MKPAWASGRSLPPRAGAALRKDIIRSKCDLDKASCSPTVLAGTCRGGSIVALTIIAKRIISDKPAAIDTGAATPHKTRREGGIGA